MRFDQWECACYVSVYKLGWLLHIVRLMVFVNIVRFMMLVCVGVCVNRWLWCILTCTCVEYLVGWHVCRFGWAFISRRLERASSDVQTGAVYRY
jgi:hypothetical protein